MTSLRYFEPYNAQIDLVRDRFGNLNTATVTIPNELVSTFSNDISKTLATNVYRSGCYAALT